MVSNLATAEKPELSGPADLSIPGSDVENTIRGRTQLIEMAERAGEGDPTATKDIGELRNLITTLARSKPEDRRSLLEKIRSKASSFGIEITRANDYEVAAANEYEVPKIAHEAAVELKGVESSAVIPEVSKTEASANEAEQGLGRTRPAPEIVSPVSMPTPPAETVAQVETVTVADTMPDTIPAPSSEVVPAPAAVAEVPAAPETPVVPDAGKFVEDMRAQLSGAHESVSPAPEGAVRWGEHMETQAPSADGVPIPETDPVDADVRPVGTLPPLAPVPHYTEAPAVASGEAAVIAETPMREDAERVSPGNGGAGNAINEDISAAEAPVQPPVMEQGQRSAETLPPQTEKDFVDYRMKIAPADMVMPGGVVLGTPERPSADVVSDTEIAPQDLDMSQEGVAAPAAVPAEVAEAPVESSPEEPMLAPVSVETAAPASDVESPTAEPSYDEAILEDPEVSGGLAELMDRWPGFDRSGILGFGGHGVKHPDFENTKDRLMRDILEQAASLKEAA
ncbi:hypothetical protein HY416_00555 [Candidatus Kaiserbacteria bacterium]|nr:hypothetical protein [Candidatus Kaiserbacteria bacterium]